MQRRNFKSVMDGYQKQQNKIKLLMVITGNFYKKCND